jgi:hypothetical protein
MNAFEFNHRRKAAAEPYAGPRYGGPESVRATRMTRAEEKPVNVKKAAVELGFCRSYVSAIKKLMGIKSRYFFLSDVRAWLRKHPDFRERDAWGDGK